MFIEVEPFVLDCTDKEQACKVLEEAAEVFGAWQALDDNLEFQAQYHKATIGATLAHVDLADEIADVIQAACNLAERYGIDVAAAMARCEQRNRERGRYDRP